MEIQLGAIGIDIGGTKIGLGFVNPLGKMLEHLILPTPPSYAETLNVIVNACQRLIESYSPASIGVGLAGQIDSATGSVLFAPNLDWRHVPFKSDLHAALHLPVNILNDVRAATWAEWLYGAGREEDNFICMFIGTGIGGGIVVNGQLLSGASNTCGEIGHMAIEINGRPCTCGSLGCLEAYAGGWAISEIYKQTIQTDPLSLISAKEVIEAAIEGHLIAQQVLEKAKNALAIGIANLVNILNPSKVILGGGIGFAIPDLIPYLSNKVAHHALTAATRNFQIVIAELREHAGIVGAAAYSMKQ